MTRVPFALFNVGNGGVRVNVGTGDIRKNHSRRRFQPLRCAAAKLDEVPALWLFCLTGLAAWFWPVTRDFTKIICARRRRWGGGPRVAGVRDRGGFRQLSVRAGVAA
jgi:hypothetical protein